VADSTTFSQLILSDLGRGRGKKQVSYQIQMVSQFCDGGIAEKLHSFPYQIMEKAFTHSLRNKTTMWRMDRQTDRIAKTESHFAYYARW